ncbi:VCBS repeat-containing protein [bacterium]|nr:VCBS repeat-containing protein [bacterium]MBU1918155.1 VCBS repeat-containing protein [bacterium]
MTTVHSVRNTTAISDAKPFDEAVSVETKAKESYFVNVDNYWSIFYDHTIPAPQRALYSLALVPAIALSLLGAGCNGVEEIPEDIDVAPELTDDDDDSGFNDDDECIPEVCLGYPDESRIYNVGDNNPFNDKQLCIDMTEDTTSIQSQYTEQFNINSADIYATESEPYATDELIVFNYNNPIEVFVYDHTTDSFVDKAVSMGLALANNYTNGTWADYDADGDTDVLLSGLNGYQLYENNQGFFYPLEAGAGIVSSEQSNGGAAAWIGDAFVVGSENGLRLFEYDAVLNNFSEDIAQANGIYDIGSSSEILAEDFNGDGLVDIFVANATGRDRMFYQNTDGTFASVEADENSEAAIGIEISDNDHSLSAKPISFLGEESPSISVISDGSNSPLYLNHQDGTFLDVASDYGLNVQGGVLDIAWADFLSEGDADNTMLSPLFLRQDDKPAFFIRENGSQAAPVFRDLADYVDLTTMARAKGSVCGYFKDTGYPDCFGVYWDNPITRFRNDTHEIMICQDE